MLQVQEKDKFRQNLICWQLQSYQWLVWSICIYLLFFFLVILTDHTASGTIN